MKTDITTKPSTDLSLVEKQHNLVETLEKVLIVVTILLHLVTQNHLALGGTRESREEGDVVLQMLQSLKLEKK